jgi:gamma-glutamyltranspeptidase/glutathione hydrolase
MNYKKLIKIFNIKILSFFLFIFIKNAFAVQQSDKIKPEIFNINTDKFLKLKNEGKPIIARKWMVVTANQQASKVAAKILSKGGTAVDAMISAQLVLGLAEPESSGLGGGAFLVYFNNSTNKITTLDGRETAPLNVDEKMFQDSNGKAIKFFDAVIGGKSVGTPGTPALLEIAHKKWGKIKWSILFEDAIELADKGFVVSKKLSSSIQKNQKSLSKFKKTKNYFLPNNKPLKAGIILKNKNYAETLKELAKNGSKPFYQGSIGNEIIDTVQNAKINPGVLDQKDLLNYSIIEREPSCIIYRKYKVCGMGPPSSGAITVNQILGMIENFNVSKLGPYNPETWKIIGDASRLAFADRSIYIADDDFINVPSRKLTNKTYLQNRAKKLNSLKKIENIKPGNFEDKLSQNFTDDISIEFPSTSHISIVDMYGNALSMTTTIENGFGSRLMTKGGFLLNNELTDFSFKTYKNNKRIANSIEPGKRPRSSMAPTIILKDNKPIYVLGSPGGSNIIGYVVNAIISLIDWKQDAQRAASTAHAINKFGTYYLEKNTHLSKLETSLKKMNYEVKLKKFSSGLNIIHIDKNLYGGSDHRREGIAIGQ